MNPEKEIEQLLRKDGAVLQRDKKHVVWRLSNGKNFVVAKTASDYRAHLNQLSDLRKQLGIIDPERGKPGERREKRTHPPATVLREKLASIGLVDSIEEALRKELAKVEHERSTLALKIPEQRRLCWCRHVRLFYDRICFWR